MPQGVKVQVLSSAPYYMLDLVSFFDFLSLYVVGMLWGWVENFFKKSGGKGIIN